MCHVQLRQDDRALERFEQTLAVDSEFNLAREMLTRMRSPDWRQGPDEGEEPGEDSGT
jgi:Tfp pilus assembly protein PilF